MAFHDYAATETSALLTRALGARTEAPLKQLHTVREALETVLRALETAPTLDHEVSEVVGRLTDAADAAVKHTRDEAGAAVDAVRAEADLLRTELEMVRAELERVRVERDARDGDLHSERAEREKLAAAVGELDGAIERLRAELQAERERADGAERDLAVTVDAHGEVENALRKAEAACKHEAQAHHDARGLLELALAETAQVRAELEGSTAQIAALKEELAAGADVREQLEARHHSALSADAQAKAAVEEELQEVRGLLDLALAETTELRDQVEARRAEHEALNDQLAAARAAEARLESAQRDASAAADSARGERDAARGERDGARSERDAAVAERAAAVGERAAALGERDAALGERDAARSERDTLATDLRAANTRVQLLESERADHEEQVRHLEGRIAAASGAEAALRDAVAAAERDHGGARAELDALQTDVDRMTSLLDAAVLAMGDLGKSTSVAELLGALVSRLSTEFTRVALFRVKGNRLEGEHQGGFTDTTDVVKLAIPLTLDSILTRVVATGTLERLHGADVGERAGTPFAGRPASALAVPLMLQGEAFAVVYADRDAPASGVDEAGVAFAKLLAAQTGVLLMRHTDELKTLRELRDYAALLLQEAEHMFTADREAGKAAADVRKRLRDNLDCASQLYAHRAALEGTAAAALLDDQISAVIETGTPFAQDLAAIVGHMANIEAQVTAEAS